MKHKFNETLLTIAIALFTSFAFAQAKKPTLMVVPSDAWCISHGYFSTQNNQGTITKIPDYKKAFQEDTELLLVVGKMGTIMVDKKFPLKDMGAAMKTLESESAEDAMRTSKTGAGVAETPIDKLKKVAKADIILQLTWTVNTNGPKKSISFNIQGLDAYTDKQVAGAQGPGVQSLTSDVATLLDEATVSYMDSFAAQLQSHFDDMFANGREINVRIKKWDSWPNDLETEYAGKELQDHIEDWMTANTVKGRFSPGTNTETTMSFENVRIPLYDATGKAIDARQFLKGLSETLKKPPFSITNKLTTKGLGQATIILGEK